MPMPTIMLLLNIDFPSDFGFYLNNLNWSNLGLSWFKIGGQMAQTISS
jgi:hypothetical protein